MINIKRRNIQFFILTLIVSWLFHSISVAQTADDIGKDSSLIIKTFGKILIKGTQPRSAESYTKLRAGETVIMESGSTLQLIYFASGQLENWSNNRVFKVGTDSSIAEEGKPDSIKKIPNAVVKQYSSIVDGLESTSRYGMFRVRRVCETKVSNAEKLYPKLKADQDETSIYAEEFLASNYYECADDEKLKIFLDNAIRERPELSDLKAIKDKYLPLLDGNNKSN